MRIIVMVFLIHPVERDKYGTRPERINRGRWIFFDKRFRKRF